MSLAYERSSREGAGAHLWWHSCTLFVCLLVQSRESTLRYEFLPRWGERYMHSGASPILKGEDCDCHHQSLGAPRSFCQGEFGMYPPVAHCLVSASHPPPRPWRDHSIRVTLDMLRLHTGGNTYNSSANYSRPLFSLDLRKKVCGRLLQGPNPELRPRARVCWRVRCLGCTNMASHTLRTLMTYPQRLFWTQSHHELDRILRMPRMAHHVTYRCAMNPHLPCHVLKLEYSPWPLPALYPSSLPSPPVPFKRPCQSNRS